MEGERVAGRYRILSRLGAGGMGVVYLAHDEKLEREVALKALSSRELGDTRGRSRLLREARSAAKLGHPGIVQVHDVLETEDGSAYIVMERVRGKSLRELLEGGPLEPERVAEIVGEVADALEAAHADGIVHRDIKPDNIMVREDGRVVVLDFGLVKDIGREGETVSRSPTLEELTRSGAIIGTPAYLAPEQARGKGVKPASDQFALAVVAYELLTSQLPWQAETPTQMLALILMDDPPRPSSLRPSLPPGLDDVLGRALAKRPEDRWVDTRQLAEAMAAALEAPPSDAAGVDDDAGVDGAGDSHAEGVETRRAGAGATRRPRAGCALALGLVAAAVGTGGVVLFSGGSDDVTASEEVDRAAAPPLHFGESTVACPQLEVRGDGASDWLGAAVASDICGYLWIALAVPPDHTEPPAALLELPVEPTDESPLDPFSVRGARASQMEAAREMDAWIDGSVEPTDQGFLCEITIRDREGRPVGPTITVEDELPELGLAIVRSLRARGALPADASLPAQMASTIGVSSVTSTLTVAAVMRASIPHTRACTEARRLSDVRSTTAAMLPEACRPPTSLDIAPAEAEGRFEDLATALRAHASALRHLAAGDASLAQAHARRSIRAWPSGPGRRSFLVVARHTDSALPAYRSVTHWAPELPDGWTHLGSELAPGSDEQLEMTRRGYTLHPAHPGTSADLATLLLQRGRVEEVRTIAARLLELDPDSVLGHALLASTEAASGQFRSARERLRRLFSRDDWRLGTYENQDPVLVHLLGAMRVLSGSTELVDRFVDTLLLADPPRIDPQGTTWRLRTAAIMCGLASDRVALPCIERLATLSETELLTPASPGSQELLSGVSAWRRGNAEAAAMHVRGFTELRGAWAVPLFALVVSPILDAAGEHELAERLDRTAIEVGDRQFNGASEATVRSALRASAHGDAQRAAELAGQAVRALDSADVDMTHLQELKNIAAPRR